MALTINTNIQSMNAQRNLGKSQSDLAKSMQRLSSGLRINSAKDDAAGLAITDRMTSQIRGINQAVRNANDGISLAQTAEGAMQEVTNILQRMREIAVQASNGTYSDSDRSSLQGEVDQLFAEIDRIGDSTQFNGISLLDGSGGARSFQIGANAGQTVELQLTSVKTQDLNLNGFSGLGELNGGRVSGVTSTANDLEINGIGIGASGATAASAANAINAATGQTGVTATAYNSYRGVGNSSGIVSGLTINGATIADSGNMSELVENINRDAAGVTATLNADDSVTLSNDTGNNIVVAGTVTNSGLTGGTYTGYLSLSDDAGEEIEIGLADAATATVADLQAFGFNEGSGSDNVVGQTVASAKLVAGDVVINGVDIGAVDSVSAADKAAAINAVSSETGVTATASTEEAFAIDFTTGTQATSAGALKINGTAVDLTSASVQTLDEVVTAINTAVQGVVASANDDGELVLTSASGLDIRIEAEDANTQAFFGGQASADELYHGSITLNSESGSDIKLEEQTAGGLAKAGLVAQGGSDEAIGTGLSVETIANANNAIERIDDALNTVANVRGEMGAVQNRLESTISNLQNVSENLSSARSRILDADIAAETSAMTKNNILQQAGVSILAQANQAPQLALSLLG